MIRIDQATYAPDGKLINVMSGFSQWSTVERAVKWRVAISRRFNLPYLVTDVNQVAALRIFGYLDVYTCTEYEE